MLLKTDYYTISKFPMAGNIKQKGQSRIQIKETDEFVCLITTKRIDELAYPRKEVHLKCETSVKRLQEEATVKTRRYTEVQIFRILQEVDSGTPVIDAARKHGVSPATIHCWKARYDGMTLSELKRLKALKEENARLKRIVAKAGTG